MSFGLKAQTPTTASNDLFNECLVVATKLKVLDNNSYGDNVLTTIILTVITAPANGTATTNNDGTPTYPYDNYLDYTSK